ncbi:MAG: YkuS family protein [Sporomusaceae bacterium]|nr:YkuS family protein [Sporomusaceae bacterium]
MRKVLVEAGLDQLKQRLTERGYEVVDMESGYAPVEAVIYVGEVASGGSSRHGPEGTRLVNAGGLDPEAVIDRLDSL